VQVVTVPGVRRVEQNCHVIADERAARNLLEALKFVLTPRPEPNLARSAQTRNGPIH
jgi:hypothetical protein